ncbi:hypothetical protein [Thalassoglobus polymorphus]|uniref:Anti-sigma-28 factor FlgM C-terminal domain-containing protein n=1 Tax=Thalassoglobus polymorphus TaxID=2527994 RepID=A0A517QKS9_9PLAN|nr:hypothetical protein [Thalassoglobus polymorphus]QDT32262.1 hypothetical protein Mal48_15050 [Thalassoglobus polymorphus]
MRSAFTLFQSLTCFNSSVQTPLIACTDLSYDRQFLPNEVFFENGNVFPNSGEAEMDRKRPDRTQPHQDNLDSEAVPSAETREERLARIRAEIDSGVYETPEKLEIAISRMLGVISD